MPGGICGFVLLTFFSGLFLQQRSIMCLTISLSLSLSLSLYLSPSLCECEYACVRACVRVCARVCVRVHACVRVSVYVYDKNIVIELKGAIRDFLQSPHGAANCLQHVRSIGPGAIVYCKSRATCRALTYHGRHVCNLVRRDSSAIKVD